MDVITYSLRAGQGDASQYYRDVAAFAGEVLEEAEHHLGALMDDRAAFLLRSGDKVKNTRYESVFELLTLGVLWKVYLANALALSRVVSPALVGLARIRERGGKLKPAADRLRRISNTFLFTHRRPLLPGDAPRLAHLERLLRWLASTGDYSHQVRRLRSLQKYFTSQGSSENPALANILAFTDWFEERSLQALGRYTARVEPFLAEDHPSHRWCEDIIFCGRPRVEYHLNMVGGELLNRAYREDFLAAERKVVIVPPCMRLRGEEGCRAVSTPFGARCAACAPDCRVNWLTQLGRARGFAVLIMGDLEVYSPRKADASGGSQAAIVGVSCVLTNAPGGWDARRMGIPAQGVPLDYCGCSWHWHDPGIPTDVDFSRVLQVLGIADQ